MTKSEALKKMQEVKAYMTSGNPIWSVTEIGEAFDMAIEALEIEQLPTADIDTDSAYAEGWTAAESKYRAMMSDGDCIRRQAAIDAIRNMQTYKMFEGDDTLLVDKAEVQSELRMLPSAQPEPQWIPCSEPPKESGTYIVTAYDGTDKRVTFVKYQKTLKRWDLTGARAYWRILAYKPLPEPWRGEEHES